MPYSMTGFGKSTGEFDGQSLAIELSAVNHRYLDSSVRMPYTWAALESVVKDGIRKRLSRGKLSVTVTRKRTTAAGKSVHFDAEIAKQYLDASKQIGQMLGTFENLSLDTLARLEGVLYQEEPEEDLAAMEPTLKTVLAEALDALIVMRATEGEALVRDIQERANLIRETLEVIKIRLPELNKAYEDRLRTRIGELAEEVSITEDRLALEVAIMAEKTDVTEEVVRLNTHLDHLDSLLTSKDPIGRKLDFLSQEISREINTLGVKTRDADVAKDVLTLKAELEKIREQLQNIE